MILPLSQLLMMWNVVDDLVPDLFPIRHCCFYTTWSANKAPEIKELSARGFNLLKRDRWGTQARHSTYFLSLPVVWRRDGSDSIYARLRRWGEMKDDAFLQKAHSVFLDKMWVWFGCLRDSGSGGHVTEWNKRHSVPLGQFSQIVVQTQQAHWG